VRARHWMQFVFCLAFVLCYGYVVSPTSVTMEPTGVSLHAPTLTPTLTSMPGPPILYEPCDGALLPQPIPPNEWYFWWGARGGPCYCGISIQGPGGRHVGSERISFYDVMRYEYRYRSHVCLPNDALGPWYWQVWVVCPMGNNESERRTFWVEPAPCAVYLPIILRRSLVIPSPTSTATQTPTVTSTPTPTSTPTLHIVTAEGTLTRVHASMCQAEETHCLPESYVYLYSDFVSLYAYEGKYVRIWGWSVPSPECELVNVTDMVELSGGWGLGVPREW
jgi:hypothetical protein